MPHPENIIPPKKGEIRNPNGRGKGHNNRNTILKRLVAIKIKTANPLTELEEELSAEELANYALITKAISGDVPAIKELYDTLYGKIVEKKDITSGGDKISITFKRPDAP